MSKVEDNPNIPPLPENDSDKTLSIEELITADAKDREKEDKALRQAQKPERIKRAAIFVGGGLTIAALVTSLILWNPLGGNQNVGDGEQDMTDATVAAPSVPPPSDALTPEDFYRQEGLFFPTSMEDWQTKSYEEQDKSEIKSKIIATMNSTEIGLAGNSLPSEESGYTADSDKQTLEDGSLNPQYSYWTAESFNAQVGVYLERLLNPTFGGWALNQYSGHPGNTEFNINSISDMFTARWITENATKPFSEYVPVYADWAGNDYNLGDKLLTSGPRWYGKITSSNTEFTYDQSTQQYTVNLTAQVQFTAWAKDQSKLEKTGTLTLKLVSNATGLNDSKHTVLIDDASLKVDE